MDEACDEEREYIAADAQYCSDVNLLEGVRKIAEQVYVELGGDLNLGHEDKVAPKMPPLKVFNLRVSLLRRLCVCLS